MCLRKEKCTRSIVLHFWALIIHRDVIQIKMVWTNHDRLLRRLGLLKPGVPIACNYKEASTSTIGSDS
eukprot:10005900-Prorocentrum_lima.AAC.1